MLRMISATNTRPCHHIIVIIEFAFAVDAAVILTPDALPIASVTR